MIKLSVCISVHNTAKLLSRCLDSVLAQTYKDIEIVIINNGSTDNSFDVMNLYKAKYSNICVFEQNDKGLAQGRQSGVSHATGAYITFLDADDYIKPDMYEKMLAIAEITKADIVECETRHNDNVLSSPYKGLYSSHEILKDYFKGKPVLSMLWLRIYKKELFNKPVFPDIYTNNEDIFALPCLLDSASTIYFLKECLHVYSVDNEQAEMYKISKNVYDDEKIFEIKMKALGVISFVKHFIGESRIEENYSQEFLNYIARNITYFCVADYKKISAERIVQTLCNYVEMDEKELNSFYSSNIQNPVFFEKIAKKSGLRHAIPIYRFLKILKKSW